MEIGQGCLCTAWMAGRRGVVERRAWIGIGLSCKTPAARSLKRASSVMPENAPQPLEPDLLGPPSHPPPVYKTEPCSSLFSIQPAHSSLSSLNRLSQLPHNSKETRHVLPLSSTTFLGHPPSRAQALHRRPARPFRCPKLCYGQPRVLQHLCAVSFSRALCVYSPELRVSDCSGTVRQHRKRRSAATICSVCAPAVPSTHPPVDHLHETLRWLCGVCSSPCQRGTGGRPAALHAGGAADAQFGGIFGKGGDSLLRAPPFPQVTLHRSLRR